MVYIYMLAPPKPTFSHSFQTAVSNAKFCIRRFLANFSLRMLDETKLYLNQT